MGQGFHLVIGYPGAVVIGFLFAWHGITLSKLPLVQQIALEYGVIPGQEIKYTDHRCSSGGPYIFISTSGVKF